MDTKLMSVTVITKTVFMTFCALGIRKTAAAGITPTVRGGTSYRPFFSRSYSYVLVHYGGVVTSNMTYSYGDIIDYLSQNGDERTKDWPLVSSPTPLLIIVVSYLYFVTKFGPEYMRHRKPFQLKTAITIYNVAQVIACFYTIYELLESGWRDDLSLGCEPVDLSRGPKQMRMANLVWWVMILKLSEFIETVFFVLRKKQNQVSSLHLYHHVSTLSVAWVCTKYTPGGMATLCIIINCVVHIFMYSYYLLAIHATKAFQQKLNRVKKYLTLIQMLQFCIILVHSFQSLMPSCNFTPKFVPMMFIPNVFLVFYLFYGFYKKSYQKVKK